MQTESAFTPWTLVHNEDQGCFEIKVDAAPGKFSALIASTYSDNELAEKDARLIAAAPKLLAALQGFVENQMTVGQRYTNEGQAALDAIAKALGYSD